MIMEGITERVTPIVKCMVLLLLIFTAKVLTSRPQENGDSKNSIHQPKPNHYVRTFTKYHHIRTPPDWPVTEHKIIKRNVDDQSKELIDSALDIPNLNFGIDKQKFIKEDSGKNGISDIKKYKVKAAIIVTDPPKVFKPGISCLYKLHSVAFSVTPSYDDETNDYHQQVVENEHFDTPGVISVTTLPSGEVVQVEQCTEPRASCYILWHQDDDGNTTVLGQGCWRAGAGAACDRCTRVSPRLPGTKFCCCTKPFCNADFLSIKEEILTPIAAPTIDSKSQQTYTSILMVLMGGAGLALGLVACRRLYWPRRRENAEDTEKGEVIGNGPDGLATGLSCVDNLTLIEHIGQGKFGSVWRGTLGAGATPVAVKLYSSAAAWQREVAVYSMPQIRHPNMLHYYGSDTRRNLTDGMGRSRLIVVELCAETLRERLQRPLPWDKLAHIAHGLSSAIAHLHSSTPTKPCIVHRDINSNNVLITHDGDARLADLGLTQVRRDDGDTRIAEAGTLRYLAPEALEGALDLSGARAALCAVDVYALGLVLWEMVWVSSGRAAALPYQHAGLPPRHTPHMMQNLVCRNKARPPLPKGPVQEQKALKVMCATCEECWDHDAEARLTAVCVEERMLELKQSLSAPGPVIHDNNLHPNTESPPEPEKNSNCLQTQNCDSRTPLLYTHPHIGRNPCMERNTNTQTNTIELIHKSLKDITVPTESGPRVDNEEQCLSVARINPHRVQINENSTHERSYQRPLEYIPNEIGSEDRGLKETNLHTKIEKPKWGIKRFFEKYKTKDTEVKIVQDVMKTSVVKDTNVFRPADLVINKRLYNFEPPCLSPPNRTLSPTMMLESDLNKDNRVFGYKEIPHEEDKQIFAVIVPKVRRGSSDSINKSVKNSMSSQSEDSTIKMRLSCDKTIINNNSGRSSRASINLELQYLEQSPFGLNSECSSSEDEHLMLLSENGTKITMQSMKDKDVLKESQQKDFVNKANNKYTNFDNEFSDPNDKENTNFVENPVYIATFDGPKNVIKRQHSLEQVSEIFSSSSDVHLQNPAGRVKTPGDLPIAIRKARREKFRGKSNESNRLSLYDDRMMFGNSL